MFCEIGVFGFISRYDLADARISLDDVPSRCFVHRSLVTLSGLTVGLSYYCAFIRVAASIAIAPVAIGVKLLLTVTGCPDQRGDDDALIFGNAVFSVYR